MIGRRVRLKKIEMTRRGLHHLPPVSIVVLFS